MLNALAERIDDVSATFVTDRAFLTQTEGLAKQCAVPVNIVTISAGKFRRYMDVALWKQVLSPGIGGRNLVDMFKTAGGVAQSIRLLRKVRPDVVFAKGGYVSLPVGYAAHVLRIPLVIHDSDVRPGLTNRVLSRWATTIATGMPVEHYRYNAELAVYTGVPVSRQFHVYTASEQHKAKKSLGFSPRSPLIVVSGGGLGARDINEAMIRIAPQWLGRGYSVLHVVGKGAFESVLPQLPTADAYKAVPFVYDGMSMLYGAADVVVSRASATSLQELAATARAAVIIPNSSLGDQLENATTFVDAGAATMVRDEQLGENPEILQRTVEELIDDTKKRSSLEASIAVFAKPQAASDVAELLLAAVKS